MMILDNTSDIQKAALALLRKKGLVPKKEVKFHQGRCTAHLYLLNLQGKKKWVTYQCQREGCRHFATLDNIRNRTAECWECGDHFLVQVEHFLINSNAKTIEESVRQKVVCGCNFVVLEEEILEKLKEELNKTTEKPEEWLESEEQEVKK